jgi:hypothetical protein
VYCGAGGNKKGEVSRRDGEWHVVVCGMWLYASLGGGQSASNADDIPQSSATRQDCELHVQKD